MKIGYIDFYVPNASVHKDPITTPLMLRALGHDVETLSCNPSDTDSYTIADLTIVPASEVTWRESGLDAVIAVSRFNPAVTPLLASIKAAGIPLIIKGDTDGTLGYPLTPNYLRMVPLDANPINWLRHMKWRAPVSHWVRQKLAHAQLADRVIVESPGAVTNLTQVLTYWGLDGDARKIRFIPNQVSQTLIDRPVRTDKHRSIMAIGRWDDAVCKGTDLLAATIDDLLRLNDDYTVTVVGPGVEKVRALLRTTKSDRVTLIAETDFETLQELLSHARILLVTSRMESFSFVSAEALCSGSSIVVTPIESLVYLSGGGAWGSIANDFSTPAIAAGLVSEIERWEHYQRDANATAEYWRSRLAPSATSAHWERVLQEVSLH